jgi:hypothetical protein
MLKIRKSDLTYERITVAPSWVTNGHWAIRRDIIERDPCFAEYLLHPEWEMEDEKVEKTIGGVEKYPTQYLATGEIRNATAGLDPSEDIVILAPVPDLIGTASTGEKPRESRKMGLSRQYWRMFQLADKEVMGSGPKKATAVLDDDGKPWLVVMPTEL